MEIDDINKTFYECTNAQCGAMTRVKKNDRKASCEVNFDVNETSVWALMDDEMVRKLFPAT